MKVYVVTDFVRDWSCEIIGVYDSEEKANEKAKEDSAYQVIEFELE